MMEALLALLFGLLIGSFLNVCIYRWPRDLSVVRPRSHCPACGKMITWRDNIPLASYAILRGRCRHCTERIPLRYPFVELLTGLLFFYFVWTLGPSVAALKMCVLSALLVALMFTDYETLILPDELTLGGTAAGLIFSIFTPMPVSVELFFLALLGMEPRGRSAWLLESVFGALVPALFLWFVRWFYEKVRHREGLGLGDIKLIAMVGSFLGLSGSLLTLIAGSLVGSIIGYGYIRATGKDPATYELPMGTFLGVAALAIAMSARFVLPWYNNL
jgi:leader peptidase (prepilin peptidase) / N-methyltransferase